MRSDRSDEKVRKERGTLLVEGGVEEEEEEEWYDD